MSYVLVPGAGGSAWYWHRLVAALEGRGHEAVAVDLPGAHPTAGLLEYRDLIATTGHSRSRPPVVVAQSLGAFSAPLACDLVRVTRLVLLNAMIPAPGETAGEWWEDVGWREAARSSAARDGRPEPDVNDLETLFFHDLPAELVEVMRANPDAAVEAPVVFGQPWPLSRWPDVSTTTVAGRDDRLFPIELQRRIARERLGLDLLELPGGHLLALSQPAELAETLAGLAAP